MAATKSTLDDARAEIDRIDQSIHDLLMRRVEVVRGIGRLKGADAPKWRPAREAALVRRLAARHKGEMPLGVLARIWREMIIGGSLALQEKVTVAVAEESWDLARDHFGSVVALKARRSADQVVRDVASGKATIGVLPAGTAGWWRTLDRAGAPKVVARLPFVGAGNGRSRGEAFAVAKVAFEPSGSDRSLLVAESGAAALRKAGLKPRRLGRHGKKELLEIGGFLAEDDDRLGRNILIGGYALPLSKK